MLDIDLKNTFNGTEYSIMGIKYSGRYILETCEK